MICMHVATECLYRYLREPPSAIIDQCNPYMNLFKLESTNTPGPQHLLLHEPYIVWIEFEKKNFTVKAGINSTVKPLNLGTHPFILSIERLSSFGSYFL